MIGVYDFCGHYEWTFEWLRSQGGDELVHRYWEEAIYQDSQRHAAELIQKRGFAGMAEYWGHTLNLEGASHHSTLGEGVFRIDMLECPSKGFLIRNGLNQYRDYCDHCMGWVGPMMKAAGFIIAHQHNHRGQCWWEYRRAGDPTGPSQPGTLAAEHDVRLRPGWNEKDVQMDTFLNANLPSDKTSLET